MVCLFLLQYTFNIVCRLYWQAIYIIFDGHLGSGDSHIIKVMQLALLSAWFIPADSVQTTISTCGEYSSSFWHDYTCHCMDSWLEFWCTTAATIINHRAISLCHLPMHQQQQAGPEYEEVPAEKKLELRENVAYRPVQSIELRINQGIMARPVQHWLVVIVQQLQDQARVVKLSIS